MIWEIGQFLKLAEDIAPARGTRAADTADTVRCHSRSHERFVEVLTASDENRSLTNVDFETNQITSTCC